MNPRPLLITFMIVALAAITFTGLAIRAEWFPVQVLNTEMPEQIFSNWTWTFEVLRHRPSRNLLTLFNESVEPHRDYECRILAGKTVVTSANFAFETNDLLTPTVQWIGNQKVLFDFGQGGGNVICEWQWGNTINWTRAYELRSKGAP